MKTLITALAVAAVLAVGAAAYAHGTGTWGGGHMTGPGYGGHMMAPGYGHMGGWTGQGYGTPQVDQKFLDETADLRKELHAKRFEYAEAVRNQDADTGTLKKLETEITGLRNSIMKDAPRTAGGFGGYGHCF